MDNIKDMQNEDKENKARLRLPCYLQNVDDMKLGKNIVVDLLDSIVDSVIKKAGYSEDGILSDVKEDYFKSIQTRKRNSRTVLESRSNNNESDMETSLSELSKTPIQYAKGKIKKPKLFEPSFKLYVCKRCSNTFDTPEEISGHVCFSHNSEIRCTTCYRVLLTAKDLKEHCHDGNSILFVDTADTVDTADPLCSEHCRNRCSEVRPDVLENIKTQFSTFSKSQTHQFLLDKLFAQADYGHNPDSYVFEKHSFCYKFISKEFRISTYMLSTVRKEFDMGQRNVVHGNSGKTYFSEKRDRIISYIQQFSVIHAENSPDKCQRVMPGYVTIKTIFQCYKDNCPSYILASEREFYCVFKEHFGTNRKYPFLPRIVLQENNNHPKCTVCQQLNDLRTKYQKSEVDLLLLEGQKKTHMKNQREKYLNFVRRMELSISQPRDYLSIGIDDMDQGSLHNKYININLPYHKNNFDNHLTPPRHITLV